MYELPPSNERPDYYVLAKTNNDYRVLAGFHGSYLDGEGWRFSTPIKSVTEKYLDSWVVETTSGSTYRLSNDLDARYRLSGLTEAVYTRFKDQADLDSVPLSIVPSTEVSTILEGLF